MSKLPFVLPESCQSGDCGHSFNLHLKLYGSPDFNPEPPTRIPSTYGRTREEARELYEKAKGDYIDPPLIKIPKSKLPKDLSKYYPEYDPYLPMFGTPLAPWHRYFAWRPVDTDDRGIRWLCVVWRRRIVKKAHLIGGPDFWWQYAVDIQQGRY